MLKFLDKLNGTLWELEPYAVIFVTILNVLSMTTIVIICLIKLISLI